MKMNEVVGILHDAFFYGVAFFNKKILSMHPGTINIDESERLFHYNNLRSTVHIPDPPDCLFPLFYIGPYRPCVLNAYFNSYCDYFNGTIENFYSKLLDKSKFKKFVMNYYFSDKFDEKELQRLYLSEGETVLRAATILSHDVDIKYYMDMFYHFNDLVDTTIEFFTQLIPFIQAYHSKYKSEAFASIEKFMSVDTQRLVRKSLIKEDENSDVKLNNQIYTICFINPYIIASYCANKQYIFILGINWPMTVSQALDYHHVTMQSIMNSLGHPIKVEIVNELRKKELTISQLARALQLARTSISRYVEDLLDELVIIKSRKSGSEIYYRLNITYLRYAKCIFDQFLDQTILDVDKLTRYDVELGGDEHALG